MSNPKLAYRLRKHFGPHLQSVGLKRSNFPREWVRVTDDVMCAIAMQKSPHWGATYEDVNEGSFILHAGIAYPALNLGLSTELDEPENRGIGACRVRANLTRSPEVPGPRRTNVWDPSVIPLDEAITDAIRAIDEQALSFFNDWTNPEYAYDQIFCGSFPSGGSVAPAAGKADVYVEAQKDSSTGLAYLASLAHRLGRPDDEIRHLERLNEISQHTSTGHAGEAVVQRLASLRN